MNGELFALALTAALNPKLQGHVQQLMVGIAPILGAYLTITARVGRGERPWC